MKTFLASAGAIAALIAMSTSAVAQSATQVEIRDAAARIVVIAEDRDDVAVSVRYNKAGLPTLTQRVSGKTLILNGDLKRRVSCRDNSSVHVKGIGRFSNSELPVLTVRVPRKTSISASGAVYGDIGPTHSLKLSHGGCGKWTVGDTGDANIQIGGSGDITAQNMRNTKISIGGSGKVTGRSATQLSASIGGNGDIAFDEISGPTEISIGGSGNLRVREGDVSLLKVSIAGSGNVQIGGTVQDGKVTIMGSGDVNIGRVTGNISRTVMGSGRIKIGN